MEENTCPCLSLYASWLDSLEHISPLESENEHVYQCVSCLILLDLGMGMP